MSTGIPAALDVLKDWELGAIIGACGLFLLAVVVAIGVLCCYKVNNDRKHTQKDNESQQQMVNMQTQRTVGGQNMQQVIVKSTPNGNMDKTNQNTIPYRTLDSETNTVRYDTDQVTLTFDQANGPDKRVVTETDNGEDRDSGRGASPSRTASAVVHNGEINAAYNKDDEEEDEEIPYTTYRPPTPPSTMPPPMTPGTPITDLDADNDDDIPPAPQLPPPSLIPTPPSQEDYIYAQVNKTRQSSPAPPAPPSPPPPAAYVPPPPPVQVTTSYASNSNADADKMMRNIWMQDTRDIQIIEKSKF